MAWFPIQIPEQHSILYWNNLHGCSYALALAELALQQNSLLVIVTESMNDSYQLENDLRFCLDERTPLLNFPDWETLPYDMFSPYQDIISERIKTLYHLPMIKKGVLIISISTMMQRLPPRSYLMENGLCVKKGDLIDREAMRKNLENSAYQCVDQVQAHGEFAVRGAILDVFPMGSDKPYRIDLFDDEVDSIRTFSVDNQRTIKKVAEINLLPAREFPFTEQACTEFCQRFRKKFMAKTEKSVVFREVSKNLLPGGIEYYLPLFFTQTHTLFDYLPEQALIVSSSGIKRFADDYYGQIKARYEQLKHDIDRPILEPELLFVTGDAVMRHLSHFRQIIGGPKKGALKFQTRKSPEIRIEQQAKNPTETLRHYLNEYSGRVLLTVESAGRREFILNILNTAKIYPKVFSHWHHFLQSKQRLSLLVCAFQEGVELVGQKLTIITETQLLGRKLQQQKKKSSVRNNENIIKNLTDLDIGDPVVHREYGVGRYQGLQALDSGGTLTDFLVLEYAKADKLFVPAANLHLISRYTGASAENAPLHRLGGEQWQKLKAKAAEKIRDVAVELLDIYAQREAQTGFSFPAPGHEYTQFANTFPFEETPDQAAAIVSVITDMQKKRPMDRVICGDVGFGKTEVALRATFHAIQADKQVAVLIPTTLLAQQHYQSFTDRFADWPIRVGVLSRFQSKKQSTLTLQALSDGKIDVVIGTHKLLQKDIKFKRLGLVIIDEEHRFGVRQKERLKALRTEVDLLTLTATPIPRTLNMSLSGMRDLSIIATPPAERHAVKTFITTWNDALITEACLREIKRGGQVYFLHNRVETMSQIIAKITELLPQATIGMAHGQMPETELEQVMMAFCHQRYNILVCSTIIESGIDVPSANTIIINRADSLGLAQLHQLRGRVGRSHHRAYAYLLTAAEESISANAKKRLEAIASMETLGAGFMLATHDLEIRGAGELLGDDQSGQIQEIGFSLYTELLEKAVQSIKNGKTPTALETDKLTEIDLHIPALLPEDYIHDVHSRLVLYKRIANAEIDELDELQVELIDRFGLLPEVTKQLFAVTKLRLHAIHLGIEKMDVGEKRGYIEFIPKPKIEPQKIIQLMQSQPKTFQMQGGNRLLFSLEATSAMEKVNVVEKILGSFV